MHRPSLVLISKEAVYLMSSSFSNLLGERCQRLAGIGQDLTVGQAIVSPLVGVFG